MDTRKKKVPPLPIAFQERHRNYTLDIYPQNRMGSGASTGEGCLSTMKYLDDGTPVDINALYKNMEIGRGRYRKCGPAGQITAIETLEAEGAMIGLIETAMKAWQAAILATAAALRSERAIAITCSCEHPVRYDPEERVFVDQQGFLINTCGACGKILELHEIRQSRQQRITALQHTIRLEQEQLRQVEQLLWQESRKQR